ncbi:staphylococcal nuclease domain-containing protein 1 [Kipferlia bialata]|uniref:Staphylococcal nuclease domain-containing protein 1 n=1 Tax=Kipferlia bialata TaxID=797122 RepID=A0A9K3GF23_9EUKA|nr:staphylococcal nuclease domain-containing protein 1 [Kipferlia bialata]|eukprot:g2562.t1
MAIKGKVGLVKAVISGTELVVTNPKSKGTSEEVTIGFAYISGPSWRRDQGDPFAWAAREFLRKLLIGQLVRFKPVFTGPSGRQFCQVEMKGNVDVGLELVKKGYATVRENAAEEASAYVTAMSEAVAAKVGIHGSPDSPEATNPPIISDYDTDVLSENLQGKRVKALVEYVRDGSFWYLILFPSHIRIPFQPAGIKCPRWVVGDSGSDASAAQTRTAEPGAIQAKWAVESRLLHRTVTVTILGRDNIGVFVGDVRTAAGGDIAKLLVTEGLARLMPWSLSLCGEGSALRTAQAGAQEKRRGIWKDWKPEPIKQGVGNAFSGTVCEVHSGDTLSVKKEDGTIVRVWLSSVRAPRLAPRMDWAKAEPWAVESWDWLRKKTIGKACNVTVDYIVDSTQAQMPDRYFVTLVCGKNNVALLAVKEGYCTVGRHRADDMQRSPVYDQLVAAEVRAKDIKKGMHKETEAPIHHINNLAQAKNTARSHEILRMVKDKPSLSGIVMGASSGHRVTVLIQKPIHAHVAVVIQGVQSPSVREKEPLAREATQFTRALLMNRQVQVTLNSTDKWGSFLGSVEYQKKDLGMTLLESGMGTISHRNPPQQMVWAQQKAKEARLGIWNIATELAVDTSVIGTCDKPQIVEGEISSLDRASRGRNDDPLLFLFRLAGPMPRVTPAVCATLATVTEDTVYKGMFVAVPLAQSVDYTRGRVLSISSDNESCRVQLIDQGPTKVYGLRELLGPLPSDLAHIPPHVYMGRLAEIAIPDSARGAFDDTFDEACKSKMTVLSFGFIDQAQTTLACFLYNNRRDAERYSTNSYNSFLVSDGIACVLPVKRRPAMPITDRIQTLRRGMTKVEDQAHQDRKGIWMHGYGGIESDEEDY